MTNLRAFKITLKALQCDMLRAIFDQFERFFFFFFVETLGYLNFDISHVGAEVTKFNFLKICKIALKPWEAV